MNESLIHTPETNKVNLSTMSNEAITQLRNDCEKELEKRHKEEVRKFKAEMKRKADKYGLVVKVETKK